MVFLLVLVVGYGNVGINTTKIATYPTLDACKQAQQAVHKNRLGVRFEWISTCLPAPKAGIIGR